MPRVSEMPAPGALTGLELIPALQGGGTDGSVGIPLLVNNPAFGGNVLALRVPMVADLSATAEADPGAAGVRWNNADPSLATELYVNDADGNAGDLAALFATLTAGGFVYLQGSADSEARDNLQRWQVSGIAVESGYSKLVVALQSSGGAFTDGDVLELTIQQPQPAPGVDRNIVTAVASSSGTVTVDASLGDYFKGTLSENTEITIINVPQACTLHLSLTQDAESWSVTWPGAWNWGEGVAAPSMPSAAGRVLDVMITTNDSGATYIATARVRA